LCWSKRPSRLCFLVKFAIITYPSLFFCWYLDGCSCHGWWEQSITFSWLLCCYLHHLKRCLLFHRSHSCSLLLVQIQTHHFTVILSHFISSEISSLLSTSTVVSSACVVVFIFHVNFPKPASTSNTPSVFIMNSLHSLDRPGDKIQPCLTPFWIGNISVVPWWTCPWLLNLYVCLILTLSNALVFPYLLCCFNISKCCTVLKFFV